MVEQNKEIVYSEVDVDKLASYLADRELEKTAGDMDKKLLYKTDIVDNADGKVLVRELRDEWVTQWIAFYNLWEQMIMQFTKPVDNEQ